MYIWQVSPAAYLLDPIERAERSGFVLDDLFDGIGMSRNDFFQPGATLTRDQYYHIIDYLLHNLGVEDVGFAQPENEHLMNVGAGGLAAMTAASVGKSLHTVIRFQHLLAVPTKLYLEKRRSRAHLVFAPLQENEPREWLQRWSVETSASSFAVFLKGYPHHLISAQFSYPEPKIRPIYEEVFACELKFDQARSELVFSEAILEHPLPTANPLVHEVAIRQCEQTDHFSRPGADLVERIHSLLIANASHPMQLHNVAARLSMSKRTLQRRLTAQQTSFRKISLRARCEFARELLQTDLSVKEVAYLTGYSDVGNFSSAFKLETGISPSAIKAGQQVLCV